MKITVVSNKQEALSDLRQLLGSSTGGDQLAFVEGSSATMATLPDLGTHDLLIIDCPAPVRADMDAIEAITHANPKLAVLLQCATKSPEMLIDAMRAGVREVLTTPVTRDELLAAIARVKKRMAADTEEKPRGKIIAFLSCKGGSGATFTSTNLGYALATQYNKKVLLVDLDFQYGDASFFIADTRPVATVVDVAKQPERIDAHVLSSSSIQVTQTYSLLPAPEDPEKAIGLLPEHIDRLLSVATENYDFVILDVERALDVLSIRALDRADLIFLVMQPMVPYVRDSQKLLRLFRSLDYSPRKVHLLGNRSDAETDLPPKAIEKALGINFYRKLPNDFIHASASVNLGVPVAKHAPGSPIARALNELAADLVGAARNHESWLSRFLHGSRQ